MDGPGHIEQARKENVALSQCVSHFVGGWIGSDRVYAQFPPCKTKRVRWARRGLATIACLLAWHDVFLPTHNAVRRDLLTAASTQGRRINGKGGQAGGRDVE